MPERPPSANAQTFVPDRAYDLGDYVQVKDRIRVFYELYGNGRLVTTEVRTEMGPDDTPRVIVGAAAYRSPDDPLPGRGWSWMALPGTTNFTRNSELENTETSAWGRAIGSLGILIDKSIASIQEIDNKRDDAPAPDQASAVPGRTPVGGLIGTATTRDRYDFNLRMAPDEGWVLPFRVKAGSKSFGVIAEGPLAQALDAIKATVIDQRVTVWGHWTDEFTPGKGTRPDVHWRLLHVERIQTPDGILPAPEIPEPPDDVALVGEAPSEPLGLME